MNKPENIINFSKMTISELKDALARQELLLNNRKLMRRLNDDGAHVRQLHERLQLEIQHRQNVEDLTADLDRLSLACATSETENAHNWRVMSKETGTEAGRPKFKPWHCMNAKETKMQTKTVKIIPLSQSLSLLKNRENRLQDEMMRRRAPMPFTEEEGVFSSTESEGEDE